MTLAIVSFVLSLGSVALATYSLNLGRRMRRNTEGAVRVINLQQSQLRILTNATEFAWAIMRKSRDKTTVQAGDELRRQIAERWEAAKAT